MRFFRVERFPVVVARAPSGRDAARDIPTFYAEWDEAIARGPHAVLIDLRDVDPFAVGAARRRKVAEEAERRRDGLERTLVAEARLVSTSLVRAMMTAFDWLLPQPFRHPICNFSSMAEAEDWLQDQLAIRERARHVAPRLLRNCQSLNVARDVLYETPMNIPLWVLQVLLALHTATGAMWKFSASEQTVPSLHAIPHPVWLGLSVLELIAAVALVLPALNKRFAIAAPIASAFVALEMLAFCVVHLFSGNPEHGELVYWLVVAGISGFVTYGRLRAA